MNCCCTMWHAHVHAFQCEQHEDPWACGDATIVKFQKAGVFGLPIRDGEEAAASSAIVITHCPWCGTHLSQVLSAVATSEAQ